MRANNTRRKDIGEVQAAKTEHEIDEVQALFNSNPISDELHSFTYRNSLEGAVKKEQRNLFYIVGRDLIASAVMVWCESRILDQAEAQIRLLATHPNYRRQGLATQLVVESIDFASRHGKQQMKVEAAAGERSSAYWRSIGFVPVSSRTTDNGRKMLTMERSIPAAPQED